MDKESLTTSFGKSISRNLSNSVSDTSELLLDSFLDEGVLRDIPVIKYAAAVYKIVDDLKGRIYLAKLKKFIDSFNGGLATQDDVDKYKQRFIGDNQENELAYILIIIDKYLDLQKPAILAKLYLAYLEGNIDWGELCAYAEILDKILLSDLDYLLQQDSYTVNASINCIPAELLRLAGVGLMYSYQNDSPFESDGKGRISVYPSSMSRVINKECLYSITRFGEKLKAIIEGDSNA